ncbi:hypothetical protein SAMN05216188_10664 [Lentzea xinjiangensis]|uniref:Uncharacterized protein n=1 Tax=Lentzea xinjiangensis TaxID=402600 RepID=A0A1H9JMH4_9PSEU|nr:hypothetical protein [Lentzea xinjiangensis]SEQ88052.1 hypothetical protein SAMN05216188_10664 [Lentzea xinjiangensis]
MRLSRLVVPLLSMWLFGNLYEQVVWNPQVLADPRPGSVVGAFEAGSPVFYYLPWAPLSVVLAVVTRAPLTALGCLAVALVTKVLLITQVNPVFRDPAVTREVVHDHAVLWAFANGFVIVAVAAAILLTQRDRRRPHPA